MKQRALIFASLITTCLVFGVFSGALAAYNLSLQATSDGTIVETQFPRGEDLYLNIIVNDAQGVAGCAFTLNYPTEVLTAPATNTDGTPVNENDITSIFPFTYDSTDTHRGNSSEPGRIYLSGAAIDTTNGGSKYSTSSASVVLFTVKFSVKTDAPPGNFSLSLTQTELWNLEAGYGTDDGNGTYEEGTDAKGKVPVLVGAVDNQDPNWNDLSAAFPVLLDVADPSDPPLLLAQTSLYVLDGDSIDDTWEITHFGNVTTADDTTDNDQDGYLDKYEQPTQFGGNDTDPNVQDDPNFSDPKYDASTDDRGPYQVVSTTPVSPWAEAGASFDMDVNYFTSDGNQNLSGLVLRIYYESSILTWNSVSDVLPTELLTPLPPIAVPDTGNDDGDESTDYYVAVEWSGGNWPGIPCTQESPAKLYAVNFTVADGLTDGTTSTINFTVDAPATGYGFHSAPVDFEVLTCERGDVSCDGNITPKDATLAFDMYLTKDWDDMTDLEKKTADFNDSGSVSPADATGIFNEYLNR